VSLETTVALIRGFVGDGFLTKEIYDVGLLTLQSTPCPKERELGAPGANYP